MWRVRGVEGVCGGGGGEGLSANMCAGRRSWFASKDMREDEVRTGSNTDEHRD